MLGFMSNLARYHPSLFQRRDMKPRGSAHAGFTLVELLVVIAILSTLAALLMPVFSRTRIVAKGAGCVSNLKQLGYGIHLYAMDYDDLFPYGLDFGDSSAIDFWQYQPFIPDAYQQVKALDLQKRRLPVVMGDYVKSKALWMCPADIGLNFDGIVNIMGGGDTGSDTAFERFGMSYSYRTELALLQKPMSGLREPSRINVLMDSAGYWHSRFQRPPRTEDDTKDHDYWGYNVLFADGHVRNLTSDAYFEAWGQELGDRDPFDVHTPDPETPGK